MRVLLTIAMGVALVLGGCAVVPSPPVQAFGDQQAWMLLKPMAYRIGNSNHTIVIPAGFVTDYASIPEPLWSFGLSPHGRYSRAAVVHDYLYWTQQCSREQADNLLLIAMKESGVSSSDQFKIITGLRAGGWTGWNSNQREIAAKQPKVVPAAYQNVLDREPNITWPQFRSRLIAQGVRDPVWGPKPAYCALGDTTDIPF